MSDSPRALDADTLLTQAAFVRALARRLVLEASAADDLVQDTWLRALQHPPRHKPPHEGALRRWLAKVAFSVAHESQRSEERRSRRERSAATPESVPGPDELVERMLIAREVVQAVVELDEPYRSTVILRFYEGLKPRHIARQQGVPVRTVETRLRRALEQLRARLDEHHGGNRKAWCLPLLGLAMGGRSAAAALLAITMSAKTALLAATLAVVAGVWMWKSGSFEDGATTVARSLIQPHDEETAATKRSAVASPEASISRNLSAGRAPTAEHDTVLLYRLATNEKGTPLRAAFISFWRLSTERQPAYEYRGVRTNDRGAYAVPALAPGIWNVPARRFHHWNLEGDFELPCDRAARRLDLRFEEGIGLDVDVTFRDGFPWRDTAFNPRELEVVVTRAADPNRAASFCGPFNLANWSSYYHDPSEFLDSMASRMPFPLGQLELHARPPLFAHLVYFGVPQATIPLTREDNRLHFEISTPRLLASRPTVRFRVSDGDTILSPQMLSSLEFVGSCMRTAGFIPGRLEQLAGGTFEIPLSAGSWMVNARCESGQWASGVFLLQGGTTCDLGTLATAASSIVRGRVVDSRGQGVRAALSVLAFDPLHADRLWAKRSGAEYPTREDGAFEFAWPASPTALTGSLPAGHVTIRAERREGSTIEASEPVAIGTLSPDEKSIELALRPAAAVVCEYPGSDLTYIPAVVSEIDGAGLQPFWRGALSRGEPVVLYLPNGSYQLAVGLDDDTTKSVSFTVTGTPLRIAAPLLDSDTARSAVAATALESWPGDADTDITSSDDPIGIVLHGEVRLSRKTRLWRALTLGLSGPSNATMEINTLRPGPYAIAGLTPGTWKATVSGEGIRTLKTTIDLVAGRRVQEADLDLEAYPRLPIRFVTMDGALLPKELTRGAWFDVIAGREPLAIGANAEDVSGGWEVVWDPESNEKSLEIREPPPVYASVVFKNRVLQTVMIIEGMEELTFRIDPQALLRD
ncbi:MAG: sigma-70 family RNA polymerase sigma factor [Planctomycetota bacterium]